MGNNFLPAKPARADYICRTHNCQPNRAVADKLHHPSVRHGIIVEDLAGFAVKSTPKSHILREYKIVGGLESWAPGLSPGIDLAEGPCRFHLIRAVSVHSQEARSTSRLVRE